MLTPLYWSDLDVNFNKSSRKNHELIPKVELTNQEPPAFPHPQQVQKLHHTS